MQICFFILNLLYVFYIFFIRHNLQGQTRLIAIFGFFSLISAVLAVINLVVIQIKRKIIDRKKFYIIFNILSLLFNGIVGVVIYLTISAMAFFSGPPLL